MTLEINAMNEDIKETIKELRSIGKSHIVDSSKWNEFAQKIEHLTDLLFTEKLKKAS